MGWVVVFLLKCLYDYAILQNSRIEIFVLVGSSERDPTIAVNVKLNLFLVGTGSK